MLKILFATDHPAVQPSTGYSLQGALAVPRIHRAGLADMAFLSTYGQHGWVSSFDGVPVFPGGSDPFANDVINRTARGWGADVVMTLKDTMVFRPETFQGVRWCPLTPIDHEPAPPAIVNVLRAAAYQPIAYAPNGVRELCKAGFDPLYAPHAYDPAVFYPMDKAAARQALGLPLDRFIVGTVAVNRGGLPSRKAWAELVEGVGRFVRETAPDALYVAHTYRGDDGFEGALPLSPIAAEHGVPLITPAPDLYRAGMPTEHVRAVYNAVDVLLCVSRGEGFGVPTLEAQACGTPVILGKWAAQADLLFAGWGLERDEARRELDGQMSYVHVPDPRAIAHRLAQAHASWREGMMLNYRAMALKGAAAFQIDRVVAEHWAPLLKGLEERIRREQRTPRGVLRVVRPEEVLGL